MSSFAWDVARRLKWRDRNRAVENALRAYLGAQPVSVVLSTKALAEALTPGGSKDEQLLTILSKQAPWMGKLATHDGPEFKSYGKVMRRWQWRGQL